jgi:MurNAc alpha-1-phosphate uridylyltransferase
MTPDRIMIFAAGHGTRMRDLTRERPKPLLKVAGQTLLDRALDLARAAGIQTQVINTHYLADLIALHLADRPDILLSHEPGEALETGGGLKRALSLLGEEPVFTLNPDAVFVGENPLMTLAQHWQQADMEALLALVPLDRAKGYQRQGDFSMDDQGRLRRFQPGDAVAYVNSGAQILHTDRYRTHPEDRFSQNVIWDQMIENGGLFGCVYAGSWVDVGTPEGIALAEVLLEQARNV